MYPILFHIGSLPIWGYGAMMGVGFSMGYLIARWTARRKGLPLAPLNTIGLLVFAFALLGSHLLDIIARWLQEFGVAAPVSFGESGMSEMGGILLASVALGLYLRWRKLPVWPYLDCLTLSTAFGLGFGRIGCFVSGCCYGAPTSLPWAVTYPPGHASAGVPVHPAPLYMWALMWLLGAALLVIHRRSWRDGQVVAAFLIGYPVIRFFQEMVRDDPYRGSWFGGLMTSYQGFSLIMLAFAVPFAVRRFAPPPPEEHAPAVKAKPRRRRP